VISLDLATRLRRAGLPWSPVAGDRFLVPDRDMDDEVFVVSDMVVEVHELPTGRLLGFNGTTEWALDSIMARDVVWLPREEQLRDLLGEAFVSLDSRSGGFVVTVDSGGRQERHIDIDAECAYARAVLATLAEPAQDQ
jgi:hypothetical protein